MESLEKIIGFVGKKTVTKAEILKRAIEAEKDIKNGNTVTLEEIENKIKNGFSKKLRS